MGILSTARGSWLTACVVAVSGVCAATGAGTATAAVRAHVATSGTNGLAPESVVVDGMTRTFLLYVPSTDSAAHPLPLVLVYHGAGETAGEDPGLTGLFHLAETRRDMIVAFLQGYEDTWNDDAGNPPAEAANIDDLGFTQAVLSGVESHYPVDMKHVTATGISNGAILTELLGCREAAYFTLVVPVEGQIATTFSSNCKPTKPISVYEIHATSDPLIPYSGGTFSGVGGPVSVLSAPKSVARWAMIDKCSAKPKTVKSSRSGKSVLSNYTKCAEGVGVTLESVQGGSHDWPPGFATTLDAIIKQQTGKRQAVTP